MHPIIAKTFGGLDTKYYLRHLFFGALLTLPIILVMINSPKPVPAFAVFWLGVNLLLYPYARFVYEGVVGFILGNNIFVLPAGIMLFAKLITMAVCLFAAFFIAPIGLIYLYIHHSKPVSE